MPSRFKHPRLVGFVAACIAVAVLLPSVSMAAKKKHRPAENEVCFDEALSEQDQATCKQEIADTKSADARAKLRKMYKKKIAEAKAHAGDKPSK